MGNPITIKRCWLCDNELPENIVEKLGTPICDLGLSNRALNSLARREVKNVEQLIKLSREEILRFRNMGIVTFTELNQKMKLLGFDGW